MNDALTLAELLAEGNDSIVREPAGRSERRVQAEAVLRSEILAIESRIVGRLAAHENNVLALHHSIGELFQSLRAQVISITGQVSLTEERIARAEQVLAQTAARIADLEQAMEAGSARIERAELDLDTKFARISGAEETLASVRQGSTEARDSAAAQLSVLAHSVKLQTEEIESARTALAHTDDVIERILDLLEDMQMTLENSEERAAAA